MIQTRCNCGKTYQVPASAEGSRAHCQKCGSEFEIRSTSRRPKIRRQRSTEPGGPEVAEPQVIESDLAAASPVLQTTPRDAARLPRSNRTGYAVVVGLLLFVGIVAIVRWFGGVPGQALPFFHDSPMPRDYFPDGTAVVLIVRYDEFTNSDFTSGLFKVVPGVGREFEILERGRDYLFEDAERITASGNPETGEAIVVFEYSEDKSAGKLKRELRKSTGDQFEEEVIGGNEVYSSSKLAFFLTGKRTVIIGRVDSVIKVVERDGNPDLTSKVAAELKQVDTTRPIVAFASVTNPKMAKYGTFVDARSPLIKALNRPDTIRFEADVDEDLKFDLLVRFHFESDAKEFAKQVEDYIIRLKGAAQLAYGKLGEEMIGHFDVLRKNTVVSVSGRVSGPTFERIAKEKPSRKPFTFQF